MFKIRLENFQLRLISQKLDAFLLSNIDNIRYLTGFTGTSALALVMQDKAFFITDSRYLVQAGEQVKGCQIFEYKKPLEELLTFIKSRSIKKLAFESSHLAFISYAKLRDTLDNVDLIGLENFVEEQRMVKDQTEIDVIRDSIAIAKRAYELTKPIIDEGTSEQEMALELEYQMRKAGAEQIPFDTIVASGIRGAMPHGLASSKVIRKGEMVTADFGARYQGYCSDCTRTVLLGQVPSKETEIYKIVYEANRAAREGVKPGKKAKEIDALARNFISSSGYGDYFRHGTGHGVGLSVHEEPRISEEGEVVIAPGMVFTIEPGIYIPGVGGVRIEDMVLVTDRGCQNLTAAIEKQDPT